MSSTTQAKPINRWLVLYASGFLLLGMGAIYSFSVFSGPLAQLRGWDLGAVTLAYSIQSGIAPIPMLIGGYLMDKGHARSVILVAGLLFGTGYILAGIVTTLPMLYLAFGVLTGLGVGAGYGAALNNAMKFFPDKRGLAAGVVTGLNGLATVWAAPTLTALIGGKPGNVPNALLIMGLVFAAIGVVVFFLVRQAPPGYRPEGWTPSAVSNSTSVTESSNWKQMLATPVFWVIFAIFVAGAFSGLMVSSQAVKVGTSMYGLTPAIASALFVPLLAIANGGGRFMFGPISDRIGQVKTLMVIFVSIIVALLVLTAVKGNMFGFAVGIVLLFLTFGGTLAVMPALVMNNFGPKYQGANYALAFAAYSTAALIGPVVGSNVAAANKGDYSQAFYIAMGVAALGIVLAWLCGRLMASAAVRRQQSPQGSK